MSTTTSDVDNAPVQGKITEEMLGAARAMIGMRLRPEGPFLTDATPDLSRNFCSGIGDLNPLYRDGEYGRQTQYGTMLAHPMYPIVNAWIGRSRWGFPGVHGFYAGSDWELYRHVVPGDRVNCIERIVGVEEKESKFSGRLILQYTEGNFYNQRFELIAKVLGWCTRHERRAAREKGKYKEIVRYEYSPEELDRIDEAVIAEEANIRGGTIRNWEDVQEGETLEKIARGPLSMQDVNAFLIGSAHTRGAHGIIMQKAIKHPRHFFRNKDAGGGIEYTGIGHLRENVAKDVGVPGAYDYGPQRSAWLCSAVTNWMGDTAFLKRCRTEIRRFNTFGDTTWCGGDRDAQVQERRLRARRHRHLR